MIKQYIWQAMKDKVKNKTIMVWEYLRYIFLAKHRNGHGIHSPAVYELATKVVFSKGHVSGTKELENVIDAIKRDNSTLQVKEMGGGSHHFTGTNRKIGKIASKSGIKKKYGRLLHRLVKHYQPKAVLELGTSLGISSFYMALGNSESTIHTIEGNSPLSNYAKKTALKLGITNIQYYIGDFGLVLPKLLEEVQDCSLVFIDGNHTYDATINYFKQIRSKITKGLILLDDIYWSTGMKKAWKEISANEQVAIDLYQIGIIMVGELLTPGYYRIRY